MRLVCASRLERREKQGKGRMAQMGAGFKPCAAFVCTVGVFYRAKGGGQLPEPGLNPARACLLIGAATRIGAQHIADKGFAAANPVMALLAIATHDRCPIAITIFKPVAAMAMATVTVAIAAVTPVVAVPIPATSTAIIIAAAHLERPVPAAPT